MMAAPMVGENSIGIRLAWRSFQAVTSCSASSRIWRSIARRLRGCLLRLLPAVIPHFALVESHGRASVSASRTGLKGEPMADNRRYQPTQVAAAVIIGIVVAVVILILYRGLW